MGRIRPRGPIASPGMSVPEYLKKPIVTCDFPGMGGSEPPAPLWIRPRGSIASRRMSVQEYLRKPIASCDFPGDGGFGPPVPSESVYGSYHKCE